MKTKEIVFTKPYIAEIWESENREPSVGEVTVELDYSAISAGTEKANFIGLRNNVECGEDDEFSTKAQPDLCDLKLLRDTLGL